MGPQFFFISPSCHRDESSKLYLLPLNPIYHIPYISIIDIIILLCPIAHLIYVLCIILASLIDVISDTRLQLTETQAQLRDMAITCDREIALRHEAETARDTALAKLGRAQAELSIYKEDSESQLHGDAFIQTMSRMAPGDIDTEVLTTQYLSLKRERDIALARVGDMERQIKVCRLACSE